MMPEGEGGVADAKLKVYGVANPRVVDASIFRLEIRTNLQTSSMRLRRKRQISSRAIGKKAEGLKMGLRGTHLPRE
jgi:choline dehydrogenase-like flavoprotein